MITVLIRATIIYSLLLISLRLTGKRQVGELQISELITTFMISELATAPIQDLSIPIIYSILPIALLLCIEIILSFLATKSKAVKKMFFGSPSIIIEKGVLNQSELSRLRISVDELLTELRIKDIASIEDVDYAILEQNGKLSVFPKAQKQQVTLEDLKINKAHSGIAHAVIIDGDVNEKNLGYAGKTSAWLDRYMSKNKLDAARILLMTIDDDENITIINKEEK